MAGRGFCSLLYLPGLKARTPSRFSFQSLVVGSSPLAGAPLTSAMAPPRGRSHQNTTRWALRCRGRWGSSRPAARCPSNSPHTLPPGYRFPLPPSIVSTRHRQATRGSGLAYSAVKPTSIPRCHFWARVSSNRRGMKPVQHGYLLLPCMFVFSIYFV